MKKRIISLLLAILMMAVIPVLAQSEYPLIMMDSAVVTDEGISLTYYLQGAVPHQQLTCRVTDGQGDTLQVAQFETEELQNEVHLPLVTTDQSYTVYLGGTGIDTPRFVTVSKESPFSTDALFFQNGQTVNSLAPLFTDAQTWSVTVGETVVEQDSEIPSGACLRVTEGENSTYRWLVLPGDGNLDNKVNAQDALVVLRSVVGKETLSQSAQLAADFQQSGEISATNALMILQYVVGKIDTL